MAMGNLRPEWVDGITAVTGGTSGQRKSCLQRVGEAGYLVAVLQGHLPCWLRWNAASPPAPPSHLPGLMQGGTWMPGLAGPMMLAC
jgi:hypothetical protein